MKIIVTHKSPDMDAITSTWLLKRFLTGWEDAKIEFVSAGEKMQEKYENPGEAIEKFDNNEVIHVDTGLGKFDHHQTENGNVAAASLVFDYICTHGALAQSQNEVKKEAIRRMVEVIVDFDHFQEVFQPDSLAFYHEFSLLSIIDGLKLMHPNKDEEYVSIGILCLDAILHTFESRVWAEKEIKEKGIEFMTRWGKGLAAESVNDTVLDIAQKAGYKVVIRKDPGTGFVRIKARPARRAGISKKEENIDLTPIYEQLKKLDPYATWFLHVSKKMLLNGSSKNSNMVVTKLSLKDIIKVFEDYK